MKTTTTTLRHLFVTIAAIAAALVPINILAAPGDLFVADAGSGTIFKFTPGGTKTTFASGLNNPTGLAFDASGNLFVDASTGGGGATIFKFTPDGTRSTFAQTGLGGLGSLAFDASGNLFVADEITGTIFKFTPGGTKSTFASGLHTPIGLAFDSSGNLFVADNGFGAIVKFTPDGTKTTFATGLSSPWGLAFGASGDLFQVSNSDGAIYVFTPGGTPKSIFASGLNEPTFLAFDASGNLFVADFFNGTIFKFTPGGTRSTFASGVTNVQGLAFEPGIPTPGATLRNISARAFVQIGDNVLIGGFIITGTQPKKVIVRAIGPSLPLAGKLANPTLELFNSAGRVATNDNWRSTQEAEIIASTVPPGNDLESAIVATLPANGSSYTAIVRGVNDTTGIGLVEVYDLDPNVDSTLANISSRALVQTDDNVMIGGFIVGGGGGSTTKVIVRAIGPSLPVSGKLADPTLELHDGNGALIASNDNWRSTQQAEIIATTIPPSNDLESAIVKTFSPGNYTAIVKGKNNTTGLALVEVYALN